MKRQKVSRGRSQKMFKKTAGREHKLNHFGPSPIMRGGIRL